MSLPSQGATRPIGDVETGEVLLGENFASGPYAWSVVSSCGVVRVYSSRDGCMVALSPAEARRVARELTAALETAADTTDLRCYGKVLSHGAS